MFKSCEDCKYEFCGNSNSMFCDECVHSNNIKCAAEWIGDYFKLKNNTCERVIKKICPKCGETIYSEGIDNGIGYVYPPFHCDECGWVERCGYEKIGNCNKCDQYKYCYREFTDIF